MSELRVVLLGNNWRQKASVGNLLLGKKKFTQENKCVKVSGSFSDTNLTVINSPDVLNSTSKKKRSQFLQDIKAQSAPGPHVFLLVLQPKDFTEQHKTRLQSVLETLSDQAFNHSLLVFCSPRAETPGFREKHMTHPHIRDMIIKCRYRYLNQRNLESEELLTRLTQIIKENNGEHVRCLSTMNLVLCGRRGPEKTSVSKSILGGAGLPATSSPGQCVQVQGEVCGRWVSLVELPALSGKPLEAVMQQCLSCISLCGPEGVHAFILVLPVGPLTDEDKAELKTIQDSFSSSVNLFTMILFTVDSEPTAPAVVNFVKGDRDLQELCQSCGGGYLIFNTRGQQQVSELLDSVQTLRAKNKPHSFTTETLQQAHVQKISSLQREHQEKGYQRKDLRITLIGKTGTGKSSSGNTILGRKAFKTKPSQKGVTKVCEKEESTVEGWRVAVVDTPGLFDTNVSSDDVDVERLKCVSLLAPGPHVFLLMINPFGRFTDEERKTLDLIKKGFGKGVEKFTIILLTHGDQLEESEMSIEEFIIKECDNSFKQLLSECGNRFHVFNNRNIENRSQVKELLEKIHALLEENAGGCYTNDMLLEAEAAVRRQMERERQEMERQYKEEIDGLKQVIHKEREQNTVIIRELETSLVEMGAEWEHWKERFLEKMKYEMKSMSKNEQLDQFKKLMQEDIKSLINAQLDKKEKIRRERLDTEQSK